jgi:MFS family permease
MEAEAGAAGLAAPFLRLRATVPELGLRVLVAPLDPVFAQLVRLSDPARVGGLLAAAGLLLAVAVLADAPYPVLVVGLVTIGFGVSLALPALVTAVVATAPAGTAGAAGGLLNAVRQVGATLGVAATGAFVTVDASATGRALFLCGAVCAAAVPGVVRRR